MVTDYFGFLESSSSDYYDYLITKAYTFKGVAMQKLGLEQYRTDADTHNKLLELLYTSKFIAIHEKDKNRIGHAMTSRTEWLRHRYFDKVPSSNIEERIARDPIYKYEPNVLEVLYTLAERLEEQLTSEQGLDARALATQWFWLMLNGIGLAELGDDIFDPITAKERLLNWLSLSYEADGRGGCFYLPGHGDVREFDIWHQAQLHYAETLKNVSDRGKY